MPTSSSTQAGHDLLSFLDTEIRVCLARAADAPVPASRHFMAEAEELAALRSKLAGRFGRDNLGSQDTLLGQAA